MKPNAPPPQLVMNPAFWPRARILKKHWATSSIRTVIASALLPALRPTSVRVVPTPSPRSIGIAARSPWTLILTLPLAITIRYGVVAREETYLERRFGDAYRDYKARVRGWL